MGFRGIDNDNHEFGWQDLCSHTNNAEQIQLRLGRMVFILPWTRRFDGDFGETPDRRGLMMVVAGGFNKDVQSKFQTHLVASSFLGIVADLGKCH